MLRLQFPRNTRYSKTQLSLVLSPSLQFHSQLGLHLAVADYFSVVQVLRMF